MARILLGFFIPHWVLPIAHSLNLETIYHLEGFARMKASQFVILLERI